MVGSVVEECTTSGLIGDSLVAMDTKQSLSLWNIRETVPVAINDIHGAVVYKYDVSLALPHYYAIVEEFRRVVAPEPGIKVFGYGHVGDNNLHLNVSYPKDLISSLKAKNSDLYPDRLTSAIYQWVYDHHGSISAEHGVGQAKAKYMHLVQKSTNAINFMRNPLKQTLDPFNIMNPSKIFV